MKCKKYIRVGFITGNFFPRLGGLEIATHHLVNSLNGLPETKAVVGCGTLPEVHKDFPYPYKVYRARSLPYLYRYLYVKNIEKMIKKEQLNILHAQMIHESGSLAVQLGRKYGLPVVVASRGSDVQCVPEIGYGALLLPNIATEIKSVLNSANVLIALSSFNKSLILRLGADPQKVKVVSNGIQYDEIGKVPFEDLRPRYHLDHNDFVLLSVGRNRPIKRMELLLEALSILKLNNHRIKCVCVGPKNDLSPLVKKWGLEDVVFMTDKIPPKGKITQEEEFPPYQDLINLYRMADLYVSVSYMESFGSSALEALCCGTPILVGNKHGIKDIIMEGKTGFLIKEETPQGLSEEIIRLIPKKEELRSSREIVRRSVAHLSWYNIATKMRDIYSRVIE